MAYPSYTDTNLNSLVLNYVPDPETFDQMTTDNQINDNEVYLVQEEEEKEIFYATYNKTTYEEVVEAYENGKDIIVIYHDDDNDQAETRCSLIEIYQVPNKSSSYLFSWMSCAYDYFEFVFLDPDHGWHSQEKNYLSYVSTDNIANKAITINKIADKSKLIWYGYCDTASDVDIKTVSIPDITELTIGLTLQVRFQYPHTNNTLAKLKLNGFNSYNILIRGNANGGDSIAYGSNNYEWVTNEILTLVYVGRGWVIVDGAHATTTSYGKTKLNSAINSTSISEAATPSAVKQAYDLANSKAPISHASSATTYGVGTGSNYGHLKLSDSTTSTSGTSGGIAATPAAVKAAYDLANGKAPTASPNFTGTPTAPTAAAGTNTTQIATTEFVSNVVNNKVSKFGDTMTGELMVVGGSLSDAQGPIVQIANGAIRLQKPLSDGTTYARITLSPTSAGLYINFNNTGGRIVNVADPQSNTDVANKRYVDNAISAAITAALGASY